MKIKNLFNLDIQNVKKEHQTPKRVPLLQRTGKERQGEVHSENENEKRIREYTHIQNLPKFVDDKRLPTELYRQEESLRKEMELEDINTASKSL